MKTDFDSYERFASYVCERRDWSKPHDGFGAFCLKEGVNPFRLDSILVEELGMTGAEILAALEMENVDTV